MEAPKALMAARARCSDHDARHRSQLLLQEVHLSFRFFFFELLFPPANPVRRPRGQETRGPSDTLGALTSTAPQTQPDLHTSPTSPHHVKVSPHPRQLPRASTPDPAGHQPRRPSLRHLSSEPQSHLSTPRTPDIRS